MTTLVRIIHPHPCNSQQGKEGLDPAICMDSDYNGERTLEHHNLDVGKGQRGNRKNEILLNVEIQLCCSSDGYGSYIEHS